MELDFSFFGYSPKPKEKKPLTPASLSSQGTSKLALPKFRQFKKPNALAVKDNNSSRSDLRPSARKHNIMAHESTIVILDESTESFQTHGIRKTYRHTEETIVLSDSSDDSKGNDSTSSSDLRLTVKKPTKIVIYSTSETSSSHNSFQIGKDSALRNMGKIVLESSSEIEDEEPIGCDATFDKRNKPLLSPEKEQNINKWLNENNWNSDDKIDSNYERAIIEEPDKTPSFPSKDNVQNNNFLANGVDALMEELYGSEVWRSAKKTTVISSSESDDSFDLMIQTCLSKKENKFGVFDSKPMVPDKTHPYLPINRKLSYELDEPETCMPPPKAIAKSKINSKPLVKNSTIKNLVSPKPRTVTTTKVAAKLPLQPVAENSGLKVKSFLESLSPLTPIPWCDPKALDFRNNFKTKKEELTKELYKLYNENIFESKLPADMLIEWNVRLNKTAGYCYNRTCTNLRTGVVVRSSRIEISTKVCNTADRLRDTLIHEVCHAANWILSGISNGHGKNWKAWAATAMRRYRELPVIARCHNYKVDTKYTYKCTVCAYSIHRHSKSLDINAKRCGYCRGTFELLVNSTKTPKSGTTPVARTPKAPSGFALYVKENYSAVKKNQNSLKHADVMKLLSQQFSATKISN